MKELKFHIGCGTVYLEDYVNIHPAPDFLVTKAPELTLSQTTTIDKYYVKPFDNRPHHHIADLKSTLEDFPKNCEVIYGSSEKIADEICMFHVLEHIPKYDLDKNLKIISNLLKPGGKFRVAVPDFDGIVLEYAEKLKSGISEEDKEWYYRFIHGTQKDKYSHHYCGYNKYRLCELLKNYGFNKFEDLKNQNFYPAIHILAHKE